MNCILRNTVCNKKPLSVYWPSQISLAGAVQIIYYFLPLILLIMPHIGFAADSGASSLTFKPHAGDQSVIFLGNIFGVVDGVLAGTGSQIAGQMFGVFNTAVLSLAGILITYTLLVSTLNTAQEGQFLGQRWSSIWVPMRSIAGISLLLPKASGYCVLQIFVMWVVLQGIGAADKVWSQALSYLNRGGSIVKPNVDPVSAMKNNGNGDILNGAYGILAGQVCMVALEKSFINYQTALKNDSSTSSVCTLASKSNQASTTGTEANYNNIFCTTSVPSFMASVELTSDKLKPIGKKYTVPMPNLDPTIAPYNKLNGICGYIKFKQFSIGSSADLGLSRSQKTTMNKSRNVAISQMYEYLSGVAVNIVENAKYFNKSISCKQTGDCIKQCSGDSCSSDQAEYQAKYAFGLPVRLTLAECVATTNPYMSKAKARATLSPKEDDPHASKFQNWLDTATDDSTKWLEKATDDSTNWEDNAANDTKNWVTGGSSPKIKKEKNSGVYKDDACLSWDLPGGATNTLLLRGNEIKDAVSTYNGMMSASLYIKSQAGNAADYKKTRQFIAKSEQQGWLLAGAYYFRLAILTSQVLQKSSSVGTDTDSGLKICSPLDKDACGSEKWSFDGINLAFDTHCRNWMGPNLEGLFCLDSNTSLSSAKSRLKQSMDVANQIIGHNNIPGVNLGDLADPTYNSKANTVFGYLINGTALVVPGQPGSKQPVFTMKLNFNASSGIPQMQNQNIHAGMWNIPGSVMTFIFNNVIKYIFNFILALIIPIVNALFFAIISPPLMLLASVFQGALEVMKNVNVNPILALANMGVRFIEGSSNSFIIIMAAAVGAAAIGLPAIILLMMILPLIGVWLGIMLGVGIMTAFYIPLVPFLIFLFATIGWLVGVIEAMVAAPIVALGIMNPEGDQAFGKGDQAIMLILGVFLRPAMMIMGYIFGIILSYVGIWFVNAGFGIVIPQVEKMPMINTDNGVLTSAVSTVSDWATGNTSTYGMWSTIFLYFFLLLIYVFTLIAVVNKSFELIYYLPDKVLRWISGGAAAGEIGSGSKVSQGMNEMKQEHKKAGDQTSKAMAEVTSNALSKIPVEPEKEGEEESSDVDKDDDKDGNTEIDGSKDDTTISNGKNKPSGNAATISAPGTEEESSDEDSPPPTVVKGKGQGKGKGRPLPPIPNDSD